MTKARDILIATVIKNKGDWDKTYQDITNKYYPSEEEIAKASEVECITLLDSEYPTALKQGFKPPFVLFYKGDKTLLNGEQPLAILGTRNPKETTLNFTERLVAKLSDKKIITKLSLGVDTKVVETALKNGNKTIVLMCSGIDYCYPASNKELYEKVAEQGLIISELPFDTLPSQNASAYTNRIIASLCSKLLVADLVKQSGVYIAISQALQNGKDIYVKPDLEDEESAENQLIEEGAYCLTLSTTFNC